MAEHAPTYDTSFPTYSPVVLLPFPKQILEQKKQAVARRRKSDVQREHWGLWPPTEGSELPWECKEDDATSAVIIGVKYLPIKCKRALRP